MTEIDIKVSGGGSEKASEVVDRILMYAKGLNLPAELSLELAGQTLRGLRLAGVKLDLGAAMAEFRRLLTDRGLDPEQLAERLPGPACAPPLNKRHMLAEEMELSIVKSLLRLCRLPAARP